MTRFAILFNSAARVWNLRFLLLWTIGIIDFWIWNADEVIGLVQALGISGSCVLFFHHVLGLVRWPVKGLALVDLGLVLLEIAALAYAVYWIKCTEGLLVSAVSLAPALFSVFLSALFRIATMATTEEPIIRQRFVFLGSCAPTYPPYTPLRILLNRSIARPLVRGESRFIMFPRAFIISLIAIGVPAFAIYSIIIIPLSTQIYTRDLVAYPFAPTQAFPFPRSAAPPGNVTVLLSRLDGNPIGDPASYNIQMHVATHEAVFECQPDSTATEVLSIQCPCEWLTWLDLSKLVVNVTIDSLCIVQSRRVFLPFFQLLSC
ncbi:hypothetical protein B0H19DRAFT_313721 [Mycena capillaripes]|nr:hypothetical protein B0H19DRAFT_313721 [Mycena capillaripes]